MTNKMAVTTLLNQSQHIKWETVVPSLLNLLDRAINASIEILLAALILLKGPKETVQIPHTHFYTILIAPNPR